MEIRVDPHTLERAEERGTNEEEQILYDVKKDLLYLRLDDQKQAVLNKRLSEDVVLDMGVGDRIVGIEILDASKHLRLETLLPVQYHVASEVMP